MTTSVARAKITPGVTLDDAVIEALGRQAVGMHTTAGDLVVAAARSRDGLLLTIEGDLKYDGVTLRIMLDGQTAEIQEIR